MGQVLYPLAGLTYSGPLLESAKSNHCVNHPPPVDPLAPTPKWVAGFGYHGGGFGPYRLCVEDGCHMAFAKTDLWKGENHDSKS